MNHRLPLFRMVLVLLLIAAPTLLFAQPVGKGSGSGSIYRWEILIQDYDQIRLYVATPDEDVWSASYPYGKEVSFNLADLPGEEVYDGEYTYELRVIPRVSDETKKLLARARAAGDDREARRIMIAAGIYKPPTQTGGFSVYKGAIVADAAEKAQFSPTTDGERAGSTGSSGLQGPVGRFEPAVDDFVIPDDLIVQGSACIGFDCVDGEAFSFDTIRLKENNLRIKAEDTSTGSFPTNDWQLTFNDSASGGLSKFSVDDVTGAKTPMTIEAGASTNSLYVDSTGRVGFRTSTPVLDLHVNTSNTPAIRLEQNSSGGFTAQTWDVAGNEANFFIRDVTGGSRLPFRIRPGAPTSSIDIKADGKVGLGTASPVANLDVRGANAHVLVGNASLDFLGATQTGFGANNGVERLFFGVQTGLAFLGSNTATDLGLVTNNNTRVTITSAGNVGIGNTAPGSQLVITNGATSSSINAGATQFTVSSSRTFKDNIEPMEVPDILSKIQSVPVVTYDFKDNGPKDRLGLIAEDFHKVFERGDEKYIDGHDVQMALWMAVQQLTQKVTQLEKELAEAKAPKQ